MAKKTDELAPVGLAIDVTWKNGSTEVVYKPTLGEADEYAEMIVRNGTALSATIR